MVYARNGRAVYQPLPHNCSLLEWYLSLVILLVVKPLPTNFFVSFGLFFNSVLTPLTLYGYVFNRHRKNFMPTKNAYKEFPEGAAVDPLALPVDGQRFSNDCTIALHSLLILLLSFWNQKSQSSSCLPFVSGFDFNLCCATTFACLVGRSFMFSFLKIDYFFNVSFPYYCFNFLR